MKTIIAGSRSINSYIVIQQAVEDSGFEISEVVSGAARGVDALGEEFAYKNHIPLRIFPADWAAFGPSAGMERNSKMVAYSDALIAVWDGKSRGTADTIDKARKAGLKVFIYNA